MPYRTIAQIAASTETIAVHVNGLANTHLAAVCTCTGPLRANNWHDISHDAAHRILTEHLAKRKMQRSGYTSCPDGRAEETLHSAGGQTFAAKTCR